MGTRPEGEGREGEETERDKEGVEEFTATVKLMVGIRCHTRSNSVNKFHLIGTRI